MVWYTIKYLPPKPFFFLTAPLDMFNDVNGQQRLFLEWFA